MRRPFRPFRLTLHAGAPVTVRHPENFTITHDGAMILAFDPDQGALVFEPEMVVSVQHMRNGARAK